MSFGMYDGPNSPMGMVTFNSVADPVPLSPGAGCYHQSAKLTYRRHEAAFMSKRTKLNHTRNGVEPTGFYTLFDGRSKDRDAHFFIGLLKNSEVNPTTGRADYKNGTVSANSRIAALQVKGSGTVIFNGTQRIATGDYVTWGMPAEPASPSMKDSELQGRFEPLHWSNLKNILDAQEQAMLSLHYGKEVDATKSQYNYRGLSTTAPSRGHNNSRGHKQQNGQSKNGADNDNLWDNEIEHVTLRWTPVAREMKRDRLVKFLCGVAVFQQLGFLNISTPYESALQALTASTHEKIDTDVTSNSGNGVSVIWTQYKTAQEALAKAKGKINAEHRYYLHVGLQAGQQSRSVIIGSVTLDNVIEVRRDDFFAITQVNSTSAQTLTEEALKMNDDRYKDLEWFVYNMGLGGPIDGRSTSLPALDASPWKGQIGEFLKLTCGHDLDRYLKSRQGHLGVRPDTILCEFFTNHIKNSHVAANVTQQKNRDFLAKDIIGKALSDTQPSSVTQNASSDLPTLDLLLLHGVV